MKSIVLATALVLAAGAGLADTIRMGTEGAYPPYNFVNDKGDLDGFEIELGNELCKRIEADCTWVKNDWDSIIPNLVSSNYDTIIAGMNISDERREAIEFSVPYTPPPPSAYMALTPDAPIDGVVAAQTGTIQASHVADSGAQLLEFATGEETIDAVRNGEAEAVFADRDFLAPFVEDSNGELVWVEGHEDVPLGEGLGIGLRKSDTELKARFDEAIGDMIADGSLNEMIVKWFGPDAKTFAANATSAGSTAAADAPAPASN
ncbi:transporter substrate-binding domain-containing protein [uncultured Paracoccus sp.]|uniref:transporter substrate-binding domain-containing protein n=1 Tax=uncultured Paracoccus sp. TaxID=189685 RepID=UPI002632C7B2|nr:transporter substrate-binding domain-containing protein [uncultured Paracoccus sp.]